MSNSNGNVKAPNDKRLSYTATGMLLIWILIIIFGIISLINAVLLSNMLVFWVLSFGNFFVYFVFMVGFFPSRSISITLTDLFKSKRWIEPSKYIKGTLIQLVAASLASILAIIFYVGINFTEFFLMFSSFVFIFSIQYLLFCFYYYRHDVPEQRNFRKPNF